MTDVTGEDMYVAWCAPLLGVAISTWCHGVGDERRGGSEGVKEEKMQSNEPPLLVLHR